jgi:hypothetical protein
MAFAMSGGKKRGRPQSCSVGIGSFNAVINVRHNDRKPNKRLSSSTLLNCRPHHLLLHPFCHLILLL